jgi:hypothetical protein
MRSASRHSGMRQSVSVLIVSALLCFGDFMRPEITKLNLPAILPLLCYGSSTELN